MSDPASGSCPATAGLYRVRAVDDALLAYVGQTGRSLRERVSALRGAFGREMPYRDPHTAAPALCTVGPHVWLALPGSRRRRLMALAALTVHNAENRHGSLWHSADEHDGRGPQIRAARKHGLRHARWARIAYHRLQHAKANRRSPPDVD